MLDNAIARSPSCSGQEESPQNLRAFFAATLRYRRALLGARRGGQRRILAAGGVWRLRWRGRTRLLRSAGIGIGGGRGGGIGRPGRRSLWLGGRIGGRIGGRRGSGLWLRRRIGRVRGILLEPAQLRHALLMLVV